MLGQLVHVRAGAAELLRHRGREQPRLLQRVERLVREARLLVDVARVDRRDLARDRARRRNQVALFPVGRAHFVDRHHKPLSPPLIQHFFCYSYVTLGRTWRRARAVSSVGKPNRRAGLSPVGAEDLNLRHSAPPARAAVDQVPAEARRRDALSAARPRRPRLSPVPRGSAELARPLSVRPPTSEPDVPVRTGPDGQDLRPRRREFGHDAERRDRQALGHGCKGLPPQPMMFAKEEPLDDHHHHRL